MKFAFFSLTLPLLYSANVNAGEYEDDHHGHEDGSFEAGLSNSLVYNLGEQTFAYGLHLHGIYTFAETIFGLGLGYELVAGEHVHHSLGPMLCIRPTDPLNLCVAPGVTFEDTEVAFGAHVEVTYEFEVHGVHFGPTTGFAYNAEDMHISLGLHTGYSF